MVIALCMGDNGIPKSPDQRLVIAAQIIERAAQYGIPTEEFVVVPQVLSLGSDSSAGRMALQTTRMIVKEFGVNITMGASNVSSGLPVRHRLNAAFIAMAIKAGVTCPITNPLVSEITNSVLAAGLAIGKDDYAMR